MNGLSSKEITVDLQGLQRISVNLKHDAQMFQVHLSRLEDSIGQLRFVWSGEAAQAYKNRVAEDTERLRKVGEILNKLADDYCFAVEEYNKNAQRSEEILLAVKEL